MGITHPAWAAAIGGAALTIVATIMDRRRGRRQRLDNVGFMPWAGLALLGIGVALYGAAFAIRGM